MLQACARGVTALSVVAGETAAMREDRKVEVAYISRASCWAGASCLLSYRDMRRAGRVAGQILDATLTSR